MLAGIGTDIVEIPRISSLIEQFGDKFFTKFFTDNENVQAQTLPTQKQINFYAKRFAAKEAFAKACGIGIGRGINFCDIEITNDSLGKPQIVLINGKNDFLLRHFGVPKLAFHLSLSDEKSIAQAFVIIEKIT